MECLLKLTGIYNVFQGILEMSSKTYQTTEIKFTSQVEIKSTFLVEIKSTVLALKYDIIYIWNSYQEWYYDVQAE